MPLYEYKCDDCNAEWEEVQKITDPPVTVCPSCNRADARKLISASSFRLKGPGWAEDGYSTTGGK